MIDIRPALALLPHLKACYRKPETVAPAPLFNRWSGALRRRCTAVWRFIRRPSLAGAAGLGCALLAGACAWQAPPATEREAADRWGQPTGRHSLPDGTRRLEYATGPYGRATWMLDLGAQGQVLRARQVLTEAELTAVQAALPMPASTLLQRVGRPGETRHGGRAGGQVWAWRYQTNDCLWFLVSVDDQRVAQSAAFMTDPRCDGPSDARN